MTTAVVTKNTKRPSLLRDYCLMRKDYGLGHQIRWAVRGSLNRSKSLRHRSKILGSISINSRLNFKNDLSCFNFVFHKDSDLYSCNFWSSSNMLIWSKFRKYAIARAKRRARLYPEFSTFWVNLGRPVRVFKKGQNMRMGKGLGSFQTTRRYVRVGDLIVCLSGDTYETFQYFYNYVRRRLPSSPLMQIRFNKKFENNTQDDFSRNVDTQRDVADSLLVKATYRRVSHFVRLLKKFRLLRRKKLPVGAWKMFKNKKTSKRRPNNFRRNSLVGSVYYNKVY